MEKRIYAVVILYNPNLRLLKEEYESISNQVEKIVYVDNNSKNKESIEKWVKDKQNTHIIWLCDNEGIGTAQNEGIRYSLSNGASHIVIFDQDSVIADNFVDALYRSESSAISNGVQVGITGPIYTSHESNFLYPILTIQENRFYTVNPDVFDDYFEVTHLIASGQLIRTDVIETIGLMREDYFIEYVDYEYCFRAAAKGFKCIVSKNAVMQHQMGDKQISVKGRKIGIYSPFRRYFTCRNAFLIQKEDIYPKVFRRRYLKLAIGKFIVACIYGPKRLQQLRYCLRGFIDGYKGIYGKCTIK